MQTFRSRYGRKGIRVDDVVPAWSSGPPVTPRAALTRSATRRRAADQAAAYQAAYAAGVRAAASSRAAAEAAAGAAGCLCRWCQPRPDPTGDYLDAIAARGPSTAV